MKRIVTRPVLVGAVGLLLGLSACDEPAAPPPPKATAAAASATSSASAASPAGGAEVTITSLSREAVAAFRDGRDDADNTREAEAIERFKKAVDLDPRFGLAYAYLGYYTSDASGAKSMEQGLALSKNLPEPERLTIEELAALRAGDAEKARNLAKRITELAPFDWHAQLELGRCYFNELKYEDAKQAFGKAAAFGPAAAVVYNQLGYLYLQQRKFDPAIVEFRKYAALRPNEPNTLDSLGEALLSSGKLEDAEDSFRKAAELRFAFAWGGVAETRFLRGDWAGGMDALGKSRDGATLPTDKLEVDGMAIWAALAQGKPDDALKRVDALEKEAKDRKIDEYFAAASTYRAAVLLDQGKAKEALDELDKGAPRLGKPETSGRAMLPMRRAALVYRILSQARLGKGPDAEKTAAEIDAFAAKAPADARSIVPFARGAVALAKGDAKEAAARFAECTHDELVCRQELWLAQQKAGDAAAATATAAEIRKENLRDPMFVYVRAKLPGK
jgi:tetratricopeptide (TPR) repeat protein